MIKVGRLNESLLQKMTTYNSKGNLSNGQVPMLFRDGQIEITLRHDADYGKDIVEVDISSPSDPGNIFALFVMEDKSPEELTSTAESLAKKLKGKSPQEAYTLMKKEKGFHLDTDYTNGKGFSK